MASYSPKMASYLMILKLKRTPGIYLVGFMASGKTTIGRMLADELGWSFADVDHDIEAAKGASIVTIFDTHGEEVFRGIEQDAVRKRVSEVERGKPMVVALGGGSFISEASRELLTCNGVTIWLDCPYSTVCDRVAGVTHRPLARDPEKFKELYETRRDIYDKAEFRVGIDTDDPAVVVASILKLPIF